MSGCKFKLKGSPLTFLFQESKVEHSVSRSCGPSPPSPSQWVSSVPTVYFYNEQLLFWRHTKTKTNLIYIEFKITAFTATIKFHLSVILCVGLMRVACWQPANWTLFCLKPCIVWTHFNGYRFDIMLWLFITDATVR